MRRILVAIAAIVALLALPGLAGAHPLGNFTVNRYAGIELAGDAIYVRYALDLAEVPTFQEEDTVRGPGFAASVAQRLELRLDGRRVPLETVTSRVVSRPGAGGLETLRFDAVYRADASGIQAQLTFADRAYPGRIGWREITAYGRDGARLLAANVPAESESGVLRSYPEEKLSAPLDVRSAELTFAPGTARAPAPSLEAVGVREHTGGGFEALIGRGDLSAGVVLVSLLIAAFWGAVHALTPGHGKALVAGYLVGTRGRPRHAVLLGATVTVTHTAGVFALGLVTLLLSQLIVPEQLYPWLTLVSGLLVVAVGVGVLRSRLRTGGWHGHGHGVRLESDTSCGDTHGHGVRLQPDHADPAHHDGHHHEHHHEHHHHGHSHGQHVRLKSDTRDTGLTSRGLLGVGVAAGLLPCPSALVVLLSAIALHRVGFGLALIVAFSLGLAATITGIGLVAVLARRAFSRARFDGPMIRALPAVSAAVIVLVGVAITLRAIPGVV